MANSKQSKPSIMRRWREKRWKKAQRRQEIQERKPPSGNEARLRAEAEGTWVDRTGNLGGGGHV